jgi:ABC-2 type transport system permease protein
VAVLAFEPFWLQQIGTFIPLAYGNHALQMAVFYRSSDLLGRDVAVLALSAAVPLLLTVLLLRRSARA